jgi:hypothetical protein
MRNINIYFKKFGLYITFKNYSLELIPTFSISKGNDNYYKNSIFICFGFLRFSLELCYNTNMDYNYYNSFEWEDDDEDIYIVLAKSKE